VTYKQFNRDDGHPGTESDRLAEQRFLVQTINLLRFIEDRWGLDYIDGPARRDPDNGRRQPGFTVAPQKQSFDVVTGSFDNMFDNEPHMQRFILDSLIGSPVRDERGA